jgi:hypothetical protein
VQVPAISKHLKKIFETGELNEKVVVSILESTTQHGAIKGKTQTLEVKYCNLDAILSVGSQIIGQFLLAKAIAFHYVNKSLPEYRHCHRYKAKTRLIHLVYLIYCS